MAVEQVRHDGAACSAASARCLLIGGARGIIVASGRGVKSYRAQDVVSRTSVELDGVICSTTGASTAVQLGV